MTSPAAPPPCPDCGAQLTGAPTCARCGLRLTGPDAARLWQLDQALAAVDKHRSQLLRERGHLLAALRAVTGSPAGQSTPPSLPLAPPAGAVAPSGLGPDRDRQSPVDKPSQEWTAQRVQNTLLGLGALLLTVASIVFAAVTYDRLGAGGRAAVLVTLTAIVGLATPRLKGRGLDATAETLGVVTLALAVLDAYGLRTLGLAEHAAPTLYAAGTSAALAVLSGLYAAAVPVRFPRIAAVALTHLPVPFLLAHHHNTTPGAVGLALALMAAVDLIGWTLLRRRFSVRDVRAAVLATGLVTAALSVFTGALGAFADGQGKGAAALVTIAALAATAAFLAESGPVRDLFAALPAPLVATAAYAISDGRLTHAQRPLVLAAVGLVGMQVAGMLPRSWRPGPVVGALVTTAAALLTQGEATVQAVVLPWTWLGSAWTLTAGPDARHALSPDAGWDGTVVTLVVLVCGAVVATGAGLALHQPRSAAAPTALLVVASAVVLPLGLATSYPLALLVLLACATALLTLGISTDRVDVGTAALVAGTGIAVLTTAWSLADQDATLLVLAVVTLLFTGLTVRRFEAAGAAAVAGGALLAALGAARGLATDQVGALLIVAPAGLVALTFVLESRRRIGAEIAAAVLGATAIALTHGDAGWLSWSLALVGLIVLVDALHSDRYVVAAAGGLLLSASSWVRLADAGVHAPEPYVVPLAVVAIVLGWLRVRRAPATRSFPAYAPGLSLLLVPSLVASFDDKTLTRPLLLGAAALVVLLTGAQQRLQAPLVIGGGVLAIDALQLLAPYAAALPRWMPLGAAGLLLVAVGATYEQRRRDVTHLRDRFNALA